MVRTNIYIYYIILNIILNFNETYRSQLFIGVYVQMLRFKPKQMNEQTTCVVI